MTDRPNIYRLRPDESPPAAMEIGAPILTPVERAARAKADSRRFAAEAALSALALAAEAAQRLRELDSLGDDVCPAVSDGAGRLATEIERAVTRMTLATRTGGRIR